MPQQYPSRSSVHRPVRPLPAPRATGDDLGTRSGRRLAARTDERRRRAQRRRAMHTGSVAAVTSAILLAGVTIDQAASVPEAGDDATQANDGILVVGRSSAASRSGDRGPAYVVTAGSANADAAPTVHARDLAEETIARASELVATEARATPALREEVLGASAVVLELMRRAETVDGFEAESTEDPELAAAVDAAIDAAAESLGAETDDPAQDAEVVAYALERAASDLETVLAAATPASVDVAPAALTPTGVLDEQVALGIADAERLRSLATVTQGYSNGRLPASALTSLSWAPRHRLRPDAAAQFERLNIAFRARFGHDISITDSYRSFEGQVAARRNRGRLAATPGTSLHGWGIAVDLGSGINRFGTATHRWMRENAPKFGWELPPWARENGSKPEPWHWEFEGVPVTVTT